jgi:hypothetical protein
MSERELRCPRCRYQLRGLSSPRCPECGLVFPPDAWAAGVLREHVPLHLDACDLGQPHAILLGGLADLWRCLQLPWVLRRAAVAGSWRRGLLTLVVGLGWLYALACGGLGLLAWSSGQLSPRWALTDAALRLAPPIILSGAVLGFLVGLALAQRRALRVIRLERAGRLRIAALATLWFAIRWTVINLVSAALFGDVFWGPLRLPVVP